MSSIAFNLDEVFKHHSPDEQQVLRYNNIRESAKVFAQAIVDNTASCADQTTALRCVREATMWANSSIALNGLI